MMGDNVGDTASIQRARARVCLALDVPRTEDAIALAGQLSEYVGTFKIGKELHTVAGYAGTRIIQEIYARNETSAPNIFLDLKFKDTPDTVYAAARAAAVPGVYMFNVHVDGCEKMCKRALEGAVEGARSRNIEVPKVIGVTVLTSLDDADLDDLGYKYNFTDLTLRLTERARKWGLDGVVCAANTAGVLSQRFGSDFLYVTPGIAYKGKANPGQKQLYTPDRAVQDCSSSILVVGSAITHASDRRGTAKEILQAMAPYV